MTDAPSFRFVVRYLSLVSCILVLGPLSAGCGGSDVTDEKEDGMRADAGGEGGRARLNNLQREGYTVETVDLNQDGQPDQWTFKTANRVVRYERDMNFNGNVDVWQYPDESGAIIEEEMDLDLDGVVDLVVHYKDDVVTRKRMSVDFSGDFSVTKFYDKNGDLLRVERDENRDGAPNVFEYYEDNRMVRVGWDENGDGNPDRFDSL